MLYDKVDGMRLELTQLSGRVDNAMREIADLKPSVHTARDERQQSIGSKKTIVMIWGAFIAVVTALTTGAVELPHCFHSTPPHP